MRNTKKYNCLTKSHYSNYTEGKSDYNNVSGDTRLFSDDVKKGEIAIERHHFDTLGIKGSSITWKMLRKNSIQPGETAMNEILERYKKEPIPEILNHKFSSPTSLPLYFYFGYQLLKDSHLMQKCGHVSSDI